MRWIALLLAGVALVLGVGAFGLWWAVRFTPSWYRPMHVPSQQRQSVRDELTRTVNDLSARMVARRPFEFTIRQDEFNRWLAARSAIWPGLERWIPAWLQSPMVVFEGGCVRVAGIARWPSVRCVIWADVALSATAHGVRVRLQQVRAGSLPVPLGSLRTRLESVLVSAQGDGDSDRHLTAAHLFGEAELPNEFTWFNGEVPFRLTNVIMEPGHLRLYLEPEP